MACRTGCRTQDHESWGDCLRASNLKIGYCGQGGGDATAQKKWDSELGLYREARAQGIQPDGTSTQKIRQAIDVSNQTGHAYGSPLE